MDLNGRDTEEDKEKDQDKENEQSKEEETSAEKKEVMLYINFKKSFNETKDLYKTWYLINKDWFNKWKLKMHYRTYKPARYTYYYRHQPEAFEGELPMINNEELIIDPTTYLRTEDEKSQVINSEAIRNIKYISEEVWAMLVGKYKGGPEIQFTIPPDTDKSQLTDLLSVKVNFIILPLRSEVVASAIEENLKRLKSYLIYCEKKSTLDGIKKKIGRVIIDNKLLPEAELPEHFADDALHLWMMDDEVTVESLQKEYTECLSKIEGFKEEMDISSRFGLKCLEGFMMSKYSSVLGKKEEISFCIELSNDKSPFVFKQKESLRIDQCEYDRVHGLMTICCQCQEVWYCNKACQERDKRFHEPNCTKAFDLDNEDLVKSSSSINGLCGLTNLGNTCFMNTALQCLSNCPQLTEYFISNKYKEHINQNNPLGTKGIMANAYANLLKNLWYGNQSVFSPSYFKRSLGKYLKMFSGYNQHDTQEFLNYLLDTLHEDLNKVITKPAVERDDSDLPDSVKSSSHWISFLRRNQSTLVDLLYGQFKSTLICPDKSCGNISITFDPFLSISLPLVSKMKVYSISCYFIFFDIKVSPVFFKIPFYSDTTFMAFRNKLAEMLNVHPWSFVVVKIEDNRRIEEFIPETNSLHSMRSYEHPKYFVFQIDPDVFYSPLNEVKLKIEDASKYTSDFGDSEEYINAREDISRRVYSRDYEETARNPVKDSANNCMNPEFVGTVIKMMDYSEDQFIFSRVIFLNKKLSLKELYLYLYKTYCTLIKLVRQQQAEDHSQEDGKDDSDAILNGYKAKIEAMKEEHDFEEAIANKELPFYIIYVPKSRHDRSTKLLPFKETRIEEYVEKFNEESDTFYSSNKIFTLGLVWSKIYQKTVCKTLNNYKEPVIKIEESDRALSIYECLNRFSKSEVLEENNEWYCPKCKSHQRASKKIEIYKTPNVLIVHLKRFNNNCKLDTLIDFPIRDFDISRYVLTKSEDEEAKYDLFAIGNHYGSMGFGHYISFAKNHQTGQWYEFDDSRVSRKEESDLVGSSAYVLFYAKKGINLINWSEVYDRPFVNYEEETK